jgi:PAS domain S-box-containing protein
MKAPSDTKIDSLPVWFTGRRNTILIILAVFLFLSGTAFFLCYEHHQSATEQALKEDRATANLVSLILEKHLQMIVKTIESYANQPLLLQAVRERNVKEAMRHLTTLKKSNPDISSVLITDIQGTLWVVNPEFPEVLGKNFAYRDWYKNLLKDRKLYISDAYMRVVGENDLAIAISVPFFNERRDMIGILANIQRTIGLNKIIQRALLDPGSSVSVTDRKGNMVYSSRYTFDKEITPYPFYNEIRKAKAGKNQLIAVEDPALGGRKRYISFTSVADMGWSVFVGRDSRAIMLSESAYYIQTAAICFLLFLLITVFLAYFRRHVMIRQTMDRLEAENKVRAGEERYKSYIDMTTQLGWTTNDQGEIVEENPFWSKYTGRGYEEIKGFGWLEDIHPDDRDHTEQIWRKALAERGLYETEYRVRRYDGVYRDYLARGIPLLDENGSVREWVGTCIDITERKQAEDLILRLNEELEQRVIERTCQLDAANKELEAFAYSVSHDLRAPLRAVDGYVRILLEDFGQSLDAEGKRVCSVISESARNMGKLIDDLLAFSRIGRATMQSSLVDMEDLANSIFHELTTPEDRERIDFNVGHLPRTLGDPYLLRQVWINLLGNAVKFSSKKKRAAIEVRAEQQGDEVVYSIRDNGAGFDMQYADKLFGVFQRLHGTREFEGTGVGLAIVQRIILRHGGRVWAEGETDKGAIFYFSMKKGE